MMKFEHCLAVAMLARARGSNALTGAILVRGMRLSNQYPLGYLFNA